MLNIAQSNCASLAEVDKHLGWGPRRLNPAVEYLKEHGLIHASPTMGCAPYAYPNAIVGHRTRRFAQGG